VHRLACRRRHARLRRLTTPHEIMAGQATKRPPRSRAVSVCRQSAFRHSGRSAAQLHGQIRNPAHTSRQRRVFFNKSKRLIGFVLAYARADALGSGSAYSEAALVRNDKLRVCLQSETAPFKGGLFLQPSRLSSDPLKGIAADPAISPPHDARCKIRRAMPRPAAKARQQSRQRGPKARSRRQWSERR